MSNISDPELSDTVIALKPETEPIKASDNLTLDDTDDCIPKVEQDSLNGNLLNQEEKDDDFVPTSTDTKNTAVYTFVEEDDITNENVFETPLLKQAAGNQKESLENEVELTWDSEFSAEKTNTTPLPEDKNSATPWRKLSDRGGTYYWNIETGVSQFKEPEGHNVLDHDESVPSMDSSLADLESAAFRYASLSVADDSLSDASSKWACDSDTGQMFSVRSLGWLPMDTCSTDPETSSADVNRCIRHLSKSHGQIMDGIGAWGDGKNLLLLIEDENVKLLDPLNQTVLQTQPIKHIRVWGVGRDSAHDFAYVAKDSLTKTYKCHVFRCDASAKAIAMELHIVCESLSQKNKKKTEADMEREKEIVALATPIPVLKSDPGKDFPVTYLGFKAVHSVNGIHTVKDVIREITTDDTALCVDSIANVNTNSLIIKSKQDSTQLVECRMRCLSFMGIGDDISLFAFISVVPNEAVCHVVQCQPNAAKLALAVQEACMLRFQKAVDANQAAVPPQTTPEHHHSPVRHFIRRVFSLKKKKTVAS